MFSSELGTLLSLTSLSFLCHWHSSFLWHTHEALGQHIISRPAWLSLSSCSVWVKPIEGKFCPTFCTGVGERGTRSEVVASCGQDYLCCFLCSNVLNVAVTPSAECPGLAPPASYSMSSLKPWFFFLSHLLLLEDRVGKRNKNLHD